MLRALIDLKPRDVPVRVALRNTAAVVLPLLIGVATGHVAAGLAMCSGALNPMFSDQPGPYRARLQRMLMAALAAGGAALLGIWVGHNTPALVLAGLLLGLGGGLLVALGPVAARVGLTSMILLVVSADMRLPVAQAPGVALLIFAGGVLQVLLALAAWPLQRYRPERFALAELMRQLAGIARQRPEASAPPPATQEVLDAMVMLHGEHRSRAIAVQSFRIIAELCDRVRLELLSLADADTRLGQSQARPAIERVLVRSAIVLEQLAHAMTVGEDPAAATASMTGFDDLVAALAQFQHDNADTRERRLARVAVARAQGLGGQLRALVRNAHWASSRGEIQAQLAEARLPAALRPAATWATLRANLDLSSVAFRHALRCGVCLALAIAFQRWQQIPHGFWIPMTTAIVLKPDFGGTFSFGALRVAGTFVGLLLATLLAHLAMDGAGIRLSLLALFCLGFRLLTQVNYGIGVAFLTGMLVLLLSFEGVSPGEAVGARLQATVAGSALALIAYALWPTRERRQIRASLAQLLDAYRAHLRNLLLGQLDALSDSRAAARVARTNTQASIERLRGEPRSRRNLDELKRAESLLANGNRLIRATLSLEAVLRDGHPLPALDGLPAFAEQADQALAELSACLREGRVPAPATLRTAERGVSDALAALPDGLPAAAALADTIDRITDSIGTLTHLLRPARRATAEAQAVHDGAQGAGR
ncbi:FUSC family protein [Xanthomonas campestris pv. campestris]|uniref:FUSC family protein n=1 Tax=Xanthomonas campestris TaxID=339 RepID=UPI00226AA103|nr:FUSC family protein [Xanthomonas campestris]MDO0787942.1 FUSC family protein [Xanthomonas campestris pv. campestris]MDO0838403.1 FUSC family protein [Xanthomonas campestris pv. campestris]MEB1348137.1 FUSC family protein [Xanthomonas campestris pv. campestris]WDK51107.1 FUSC family protein [Xanthomonas campestris pv. campestris]WDK52647.1 FUSC family protein [Xanthomonas campestris pv. campestris]